MTKCNTDQLIDPAALRYLTTRNKELIQEQKRCFEAMRAEGTSVVFSDSELTSMIAFTKARRNELATMVISLQKTETDKRQRDLDAFEAECRADETSDVPTLSLDGYPDGEGQAPRGLQHENGEL